MQSNREDTSRLLVRHFSPDGFEACGRFIDVDGGRLFTVSTGEASEKPPIIFLHGIPTWSWIWRQVMAVTALERRSIALDLPGFGRSTLDTQCSFDASTIAGMIEQTIVRLNVADSRPVLVAHDFGVLIASEMIARDPIRYSAVVITNTSLRPESWTGSGWGIDLLAPLRVPGLGQLSMAMARSWMLRWAANPFVADPVDPGWFDGFWYPFEHSFGQSLARFYQSTPIRTNDFERWRSALEDFPGLSLVVWGGRDPAFGARDFQDVVSILKSPETVVIDRASHFLMEDRPRVLGRTINRFLAGML